VPGLRAFFYDICVYYFPCTILVAVDKNPRAKLRSRYLMHQYSIKSVKKLYIILFVAIQRLKTMTITFQSHKTLFPLKSNSSKIALFHEIILKRQVREPFIMFLFHKRHRFSSHIKTVTLSPLPQVQTVLIPCGGGQPALNPFQIPEQLLILDVQLLAFFPPGRILIGELKAIIYTYTGLDGNAGNEWHFLHVLLVYFPQF